MLNTDINGLIQDMKTNKTWHLVFLILGCIIGFYIINKVFYANGDANPNGFANILIGTVQGGNRCGNNVPGLDKLLIENEINLPNRNPAFLTSSMVVPAPTINEEERKKTRMDILNMFYSSNDDDMTSYNNRPRGLYIIP